MEIGNDDDLKLLPQDTDDEVKLHLEEANVIKKEWFSYVFASIQRLSDKIENNTLQLQKEKEELLKILMTHRDELKKVIQDNELKHRDDLEKLRDNLDKIINDIKSKLGALTNENTELKLLIETELNVLKKEFRDNLEITLRRHIEADEKRFTALEKKVGTMHNVQTILTAKVGVWVIVLSLIITGIVTTFAGGMLVVFKDAIMAYLGVPL